MAHVLHDKALHLSDAQQSVNQHEDQLAEHEDQLAEHEAQLTEHRGQLAEILPRVGQLEGAKSRTDRSAGACTRTLTEMQRTFARQKQWMRQGINGVKKRALAEARGTKRNFDEMSEEMSLIDQRGRADTRQATADMEGIRSDQKRMKACLEQAWVAAGKRIAEYVTQQMDQFGRLYEADKQAVEAFYRQYKADQQAVRNDMKMLETGLITNLTAVTDPLRAQQNALQAELQNVAEESRASRSRPVPQSHSGVSHQPMTDVLVAPIEPEPIQDRHESKDYQAGPSPHVHHQASATSRGSIPYPPLPNVHVVQNPLLPEMDGNIHVSSDNSRVDGLEPQQRSKRRRPASPALQGFRRCQTRLQGSRCSGLTERAEGEAENTRVWFCGKCLDP
ncbi:MAG: hypothetical protein Q9184_007197 [Pyrenodesmia sp. 2 TL-2023]